MKLYNKTELTHSRIFFDKQPPIFLTIFILSMLFLVASFFFITSILTRTYVVSAQGVVITEDLTLVGSFADGIVVELVHPEGSFVEVGDVLFTVTSGVEGLQYQSLIDQLEHQEDLLEVMDLFERSINEQTNHMTNSGIQQEYYARVEHYLLAIQSDTDNADVMAAELHDQRTQVLELNNDITSLNDQIRTLSTRITNLETEIRNTSAEIEEAREDADIEDPPIMIPNPEYTRLNTDLEEARTEHQTLESRRDGYASELDGIEREIRQQERQPDSTHAEQARIQLLAELGASRTATETRIVEITAELEMHRTQDGLHEVRANQSGYVHYLVPLREGMMIQSMQSIAEISMNREEEMQVEIFIPAHQISRVEVGQDVNVAIDGVNVSKYGTISGTLVSLDVGTMSQETPQGNMLFYRGIVEINYTYLQASNGDVVHVLRSMPVTARVVYERETYLNWILSMLQFRNE